MTKKYEDCRYILLCMMYQYSITIDDVAKTTGLDKLTIEQALYLPKNKYYNKTLGYIADAITKERDMKINEKRKRRN